MKIMTNMKFIISAISLSSLLYAVDALKLPSSPSSHSPQGTTLGPRGGVLQKKRPLFGIGGTASKHESSDIKSNGRVKNLTDATGKTIEMSKSQTTVISGNDDSVDAEYKRAMFRTILTVSGAALFGVALMATRGVSAGYEFFAGYLIEQSLSIDNLFVFIMLFEYFDVPINLQSRVLSWGITGAIALRGLMIAVGVAALQKFKSVILVFAGILIASSINLLLEKDDHGASSSSDGHEENLVMKFTKFIFPNTSSELHGERFFIDGPDGKQIATPLFLCLIAVELSDFVFAVDSIPAVLGVSKDPLIVYASNIFAIMALRSLYTVVAKAVASFRYLKPAVALVLGFVGSKMIAEYCHIDIGTGLSLAVVCSILGTGVIASIMENERRRYNFVAVGASTFTNTTVI
jgi:TerC family integral membrane protein